MFYHYNPMCILCCNFSATIQFYNKNNEFLDSPKPDTLGQKWMFQHKLEQTTKHVFLSMCIVDNMFLAFLTFFCGVVTSKLLWHEGKCGEMESNSCNECHSKTKT